MPPRQRRARNFCFTSFNVGGCTNAIQSPLQKGIKYVIGGLEICPESGRNHVQGYVEFADGKTLSAVKQIFGDDTLHLEPRRGTPREAADYCRKDGCILFEYGTLSSPGRRSDLEKVREFIADGKSMEYVVQNCSSYQGIKGAEKILLYCEPPRDFPPVVYWFYGATGTGKTRRAMSLAEEYSRENSGRIWISGKSLRWWEGYDAHPIVIIDDFRKDFCTFHELLRILDRYQYRVENKGGSRQLRAKIIIITSPYSPEITYDTREDIQQLLRRIDTQVLFE